MHLSASIYNSGRLLGQHEGTSCHYHAVMNKVIERRDRSEASLFPYANNNKPGHRRRRTKEDVIKVI